MLPGLSAGFGRHPDLRIRYAEDNEDEIGKAIPEPVIAQLDIHVDLLGSNCSYGDWAHDDAQAMFHTAYVVLRDTGRRPGEVCGLPLDCLEAENGEYSLIYHNYKRRRLRRRLPITTATAREIQAWQQRRAAVPGPESARAWLFPAMTVRDSKGAPGHQQARCGDARMDGSDSRPARGSARARRNPAAVRPVADIPEGVPVLLRPTPRRRGCASRSTQGADGPSRHQHHPAVLQPSGIASDG